MNGFFGGRKTFLAAMLLLGLLALISRLTTNEKAVEPGEPATPPATGKAADAPARSGKTQPPGTGFDFYVLALSWSPSYCEAEGADANAEQCDTARPYAFVVHGLWPQFERGYPEDCQTSQGNVGAAAVSALTDIMPAPGLIRHQWRKHGSCSGLSQADYFATLRAAREKIVIPDEFRRLGSYRTVDPDDVERSFRQSNRGLAGQAIAVTCDRRYLREVRICLTRDLQFRSCDEIDRRDCRLDKAVMPPVRGG